MIKDTPLSQQNNQLTLDIDGMTCAACAARIERVLQKSEYIKNVSVSFPLKTAQVEIKNKDNFDLDQVIKKINGIGYKAKISSELEETNRSKFFFVRPIISLLLTFIMRYFISSNYESIAYLIGFLIVLYFGKDFHISAFKKIK